jgi:hypothetical protein
MDDDEAGGTGVRIVRADENRRTQGEAVVAGQRSQAWGCAVNFGLAGSRVSEMLSRRPHLPELNCGPGRFSTSQRQLQNQNSLRLGIDCASQKSPKSTKIDIYIAHTFIIPSSGL